LKAGHAVLSALWACSAGLERFAPHPLVGRPFLLVTEIKAGGYIAVPGECRISLILKLIPGQSLDDAKAGLEAAVHSARLDSEIRLAFACPAGRDHPVVGTPTETPEATPFVRLLAAAVRSVRPDRGAIEGAPRPAFSQSLSSATTSIRCFVSPIASASSVAAVKSAFETPEVQAEAKLSR
jgi:acetylornithine deacetylase